MKSFGGKMKAVTFSYDDGVRQDIRLVELFNKYGLKGTFNLNSQLLGQGCELMREGKLVSHKKVSREDVRAVYSGHEVATHSLTHPHLENLSADEIFRELEQDRIILSELAGYEVVGHAYPYGTYSDEVVRVIKERTGIKYARTVTSTHNFDLQTELITFNPTVYHHREMDKMFELGEKFLSMKPDEPQLFYIWGHAYEFDIHDDWARFEEFLKMISGHADVFYGTNRECLLFE